MINWNENDLQKQGWIKWTCVIWQTYKKEFMLLSTMLHYRCFITLGSRLNTGWIFPVPPMGAMLRFMEHKVTKIPSFHSL
ncbi:hypothetical protein C0J52_28359 [Blattella germanica]|nr:hypothetical protein C0J52_28359 [Blattella germanica]